MYLCYRGSTYCRKIDLLNIVNPRKIEKAANRSHKVFDDVFDDRIFISLKPTLYQYRGVSYLKSVS